MTTRTAAKKATVKSIAADVQGKAKTAYAKSSAVAGEFGAVTKGNVEAVVASGKILGAGLKDLSVGSIAESRAAAGTLIADLKTLATVKSPTELFGLQVKLAKRNIDAALALGTKNGQAIGKLAGDVAQPITTQVKANVAKLRAAA